MLPAAKPMSTVMTKNTTTSPSENMRVSFCQILSCSSASAICSASSASSSPMRDRRGESWSDGVTGSRGVLGEPHGDGVTGSRGVLGDPHIDDVA